MAAKARAEAAGYPDRFISAQDDDQAVMNSQHHLCSLS